MIDIELAESNTQVLNTRYRQLIEQAYNLRQTDHAMSDVSEYNALKILNRLNTLKYLSIENSKSTS